MRNKFNYGELVRVNGVGKEFGKVENQLGFIISKDEFYNDYNVDLIFGKKDWFCEDAIERILKNKRSKPDRYQVRLCTSKRGYEILKENIKKNEPISNNKFKKIDIYKKIERNGNIYIILGWKSIFWPISNKSIIILEDTLQYLKKLNLPFQYIVLNENIITDIRIIEYSTNNTDANVFQVERKIKINKLK